MICTLNMKKTNGINPKSIDGAKELAHAQHHNGSTTVTGISSAISSVHNPIPRCLRSLQTLLLLYFKKKLDVACDCRSRVWGSTAYPGRRAS